MTPLQELVEQQTQSVAHAVNKHQLALSTLSTLLRQHHQHQDLKELLRTFVLSVSGQFRIPNVFVELIAAPVELPSQLTFFGVGQFRKCRSAIDEQKESIIRKFGTDKDALFDEDWSNEEADYPLARMLETTGVHVLLAFRHDNKVVGWMGLGSRPPDGRYSEEDIEVLRTYAASITPFFGDLFLMFTLADINRRHANILNATRQAIMVFDRAGCLVMLNEAANRLLVDDDPDSSASSLIGMSHRLLFPPQSFAQWHKLMTEVIENHQVCSQGTVKSDTSGRVYRVSITCLDDKEPNHSDLVVVMDDITEQKNQEDQFLTLQVAAEKGYMTAGIAHEMNNFVAVILAGAGLAAHQIKLGKFAEAAKDLELVIDNADRLERYSKGLVNQHRLDTVLAKADINGIIRNLIPFVEAQKRFFGIEVQLRLDPSLTDVQVDADQISQVLLNLLNNAADAIIEAKRTRGSIELITGRTSDGIQLTVTDNGCGITDTIRGLLFKERFTSKKNGHGYGMILCEKIISNHNGAISFTSAVGKGTTFTISLPLK